MSPARFLCAKVLLEKGLREEGRVKRMIILKAGLFGVELKMIELKRLKRMNMKLR